MTFIQHVESIVVCCLDKDYSYKSVATQMPHDAGWYRYDLPRMESETAACEAMTLLSKAQL